MNINGRHLFKIITDFTDQIATGLGFSVNEKDYDCDENKDSPNDNLISSVGNRVPVLGKKITAKTQITEIV